jgi:hypothetical protein
MSLPFKEEGFFFPKEMQKTSANPGLGLLLGQRPRRRGTKVFLLLFFQKKKLLPYPFLSSVLF